MDSGVEHLTDLGLVNYVQHPSNKDYVVFRFADIERAKSFKTALDENKIWYESSEDTPRTKTFYLFGIHRRDYKKVQDINFNVEARHRSFLIKNNFFRYFVLIFVTATIVLGVMGHCAQQKTLEEANKRLQQTQ